MSRPAPLALPPRLTPVPPPPAPLAPPTNAPRSICCCSEERTERGGLAAYASTNRELDALKEELQLLHDAGGADGFLLYLLGLVHIDK